MKMAERGLVSAPNMAVGQPFNIGLTGGGLPTDIPSLYGHPGAANSNQARASQ